MSAVSTLPFELRDSEHLDRTRTGNKTTYCSNQTELLPLYIGMILWGRWESNPRPIESETIFW